MKPKMLQVNIFLELTVFGLTMYCNIGLIAKMCLNHVWPVVEFEILKLIESIFWLLVDIF